MMKVSTKSRYGVAAMVDLAQHFGEGPVALRNVAERQQVSEHYLEQLVSSLRKAGFVRSIRGAQGGYVLAKEPAEITVGDIVRAMEGPIAPVDCLLAEQGPKNPYCSKTCGCIRRDIWRKMGDSISSTLDSITLENLCEDAKKIIAEERGEKIQ
jgi:Rrf2 family transcriptional regulator, cysteine metabolism repressor